MKKLSIIIPVYNVEKYIENCIESILKQNINNYEIILVNDGSTDHCGDICDKYSNKYKFIKTIHKKNGGLSDARNVGIRESSGEYLMFIDSDDFINEDIEFNKIINCLKYDVTQYKMLYFYEKNNKKVFLKNLHINNKTDKYEQLRLKVSNGELSVSACDKIIKRKIIIDNKLYFENGLLSEDIDWSLRLYLVIDSLYTINLDTYVYRQNRKGSITNTCSEKSILSLYSIINKWKNYDYQSDEIKTIYLSYLAYQYSILITIINKKNCTKDMRKKIYDMINILDYSQNKKVKLCRMVIKIFGIKIGTLILKIYLELKNHGIVKI